MAFTFLGPDPLEVQLQEVLDHLANGVPPRSIERTQIDVKEEPGRRSGATIQPGQRQNEAAAGYLAGEMACLANTPGGGAVIVGIADDGTRIGTELDPEWLRHRMWELSERRLTVSVRAGFLDGARILVLTTHEALEPIRHAGRVRWRVDDHCVEIDPTSWHAGRIRRTGVDWSAQSSGHTLGDASAAAMEVARRYLVAAGDEGANDLAAATDHDLIRRLNLVDGEGRLTNAGSLLFVGTPHEGIDYIRRDAPASNSTVRIRGRRALIEQLWEVDQASQANNRIVHVDGGFAQGQLRALPPRALREAIVNGVVHRDWLSAQPTTVEHTGDELVVSSPGGFVGGVDANNIITHPSTPRYKSLAEAMASLRLAEREGIGVDRMVRDMLALGRPGPQIAEVPGPYVRAALIGGEPDHEYVAFLATLPTGTSNDLDALLILNHLIGQGWADARSTAPTLQRLETEADSALRRLIGSETALEPGTIVAVQGVPEGQAPAYRFSDRVRSALTTRLRGLATPAGREQMLISWSRHRGRISTTEAADLTGLSSQACGQILRALEEQEILAPGRPTRFGRGFFYVPR